jgi:hypothetical protein
MPSDFLTYSLPSKLPLPSLFRVELSVLKKRLLNQTDLAFVVVEQATLVDLADLENGQTC